MINRINKIADWAMIASAVGTMVGMVIMLVGGMSASEPTITIGIMMTLASLVVFIISSVIDDCTGTW
jgi:hypothetical protein